MNPANPPKQVTLADGTVLQVPVMSMFTILHRLQPWVEQAHKESLAGIKPHPEMEPETRLAVARANAELARKVPPPSAGEPGFLRLLNGSPDGAALHLRCMLGESHPEYATAEGAADLLKRLSFAEYFDVMGAAWGGPGGEQAPKSAAGGTEEEAPADA
jgi:hypothetical protein